MVSPNQVAVMKVGLVCPLYDAILGYVSSHSPRSDLIRDSVLHRVQILSFSCSFRQKKVSTPTLGVGSATAIAFAWIAWSNIICRSYIYLADIYPHDVLFISSDRIEFTVLINVHS